MLPWIVAVAGALHCALTAAWVLLDHSLVSYSDSAMHHLASQIYSRVMALGNPGDLWDWIGRSNASWPPLTFLYHGLLGWLVSDATVAIRLYTLPFMLLLLWCVYRIGTSLGDRSTGALAALLIGLSVGLTLQTRHVSLELPATLAVSLALLILVEGRLRRGPWSVLLFGAACGVAFLTRVQALFFLCLPALFLYGALLWQARSWRARGRLLLALAVGLLLMLLVSSVHWYRHLMELITLSQVHTDPTMVPSLGDPTFVAGLGYFVHALGKVAGWPVLLAALATAPLLFRRNRRAALLLGGLVLGGVLFFALTVSREERYILPAAPALCLMAALGLRHLRPRLARPAGVLLLLGAVLPALLLSSPRLQERWIDGPKAATRWRQVFPTIIRPPVMEYSDFRRLARDWIVTTVERQTAAGERSNMYLLMDSFEDEWLASEVFHRLPGRPVLKGWNEGALRARFVQDRSRTHRAVILSERAIPLGKLLPALDAKGYHYEFNRAGALHLRLLSPGWAGRLPEVIWEAPEGQR